MIRKLLFLSGVSLALYGGAASAAQDPSAGRLYVHVGAGDVILAEGATISAGGAVVPGATVSINDSVTPLAEVGYFLTPNFAVSFTGGYPPTANVQGAGSLAGLGELGKAVYGPMALTAHYHLLTLGRFRPYIGGGLVFMHVFSTTDKLMTNIDVKDHFGYAGQVGADFVVNNHWGAFLDFKKAHLRTSATGTMFGAPIAAKIKLDPGVVSGGLGYRF
jgi:outer membrane protein